MSFCTRTPSTHAILTKQQTAASVLLALNFPLASASASGARPSIITSFQNQHHHHHHRKNFSTTPRTQWKETFPAPDAPTIRKTPPAWPHPIYTYDQMTSVQVAQRECKTWSDRIALGFVRTLRWGLDVASGYRKGSGQMSERQYMIRNIFLESVAGVPGMAAGMLRHLHSMRRMKRDNGWIESLLEESYNERMHLLTFLKMAEPGW